MADIGLSPGLLIKAVRATWKGVRLLARDPYGAMRNIQRLKWWGVSWTFGDFLGMNRSGTGPIYVSCLQVSGVNKGKVVQRIDGHVTSNITGQKIPLTMEGMRPDETNGIPAGCRFFVQALFRDGATDHEGLVEERFMAEWRDFTFVFVCDEKRHCHRFREKEVLGCISRFREASSPRVAPRITKRGSQ